jgi:hypothetical protein
MKFRLDIVGLSTEEKPTTGVEDGTTYYTVDTQELYIYYKGIWYNQEPQSTNTNSNERENLEIKKEETQLEEPVIKEVEEVKGE